VTIPETVITIKATAFQGCNSLATLLVQPVAVDAGVATGDAPPNANPFSEIPLANVTNIWAPDHVINQLTGPFNNYATLAEVPRKLRVAPDATTWTGVQLWLDWSDPQQDAWEGRVLDPSRQQMVWTLMHVAERLDIIPPELWMMIITFVKHE